MGAYDISRISFDPAKHYSSVRMQQGRVLTDADQIEDESIDAEEQRRAQQDIIGNYGSPDSGFFISAATTNAAGLLDFTIAKGAVYLSGIRFELDKDETYLDQDDWLYREGAPVTAPVLQPGQEQYDLIYLEAWQQYVTAVEDRSLFEVALGGPDTTTRIRNMRRVKVFNSSGSEECAVSWHKARQTWQDDHLGIVDSTFERKTNTLLTVGFIPGDTEDLCSPSVAGGYLGAENQAIRIQITKAGFFTWGFDNASPLYRVNITTGTDLVTMLTLPKDQYHWPVAGQVVEILPWSAVLPNGEIIAEEVGFLSTVSASFDPDLRTFSMADTLTLPQLAGQEYFYLRVWNRGNDLSSDAEISFNPGTPVTLGKIGLTISFSSSDANTPNMVRGDFWIIGARPDTPDKVYPWELKTGMHAFGVKRFFAPLAILKWTADANGKVVPEIIHDCRQTFQPLTSHDCCCTYSVGDGVFSKGDFNSIQEAIDHLPAEGGKICVLRGVHDANVIIKNKRKIQVTGCGLQTIVRASIKSERNRFGPVFTIQNSEWIILEQMIIVSMDGIGVLLQDDWKQAGSTEIHVRYNHFHALVHAVRIEANNAMESDNHIQVIYNRISMINDEKGDVAIFSLANGVLIERNKIVVDRGGGGDDGGGGGDEPPPGEGEDPCDCDRTKLKYRRLSLFRKYLETVFSKLSVNVLLAASHPREYIAKGGIQIGSSSERVLVLMNEIMGGAGHGVILGHVMMISEPEVRNRENLINREFYAPLQEIAIAENTILGMYLSGISADTSFRRGIGELVYVTDLTIYKNLISHCAMKLPDEPGENIIGYGGISLAIAEDSIIRENRIEHNGLSQIKPVCGIFILISDQVDISNNRILENGPRGLIEDRFAQPGYRAGILIRLMVRSMKQPQFEKLRATNLPGYGAGTAVKIHDNRVVQPLGHALWLAGAGEVSIVSNQFSSHGIDPSNSFSRVAACIYILNSGLSNGIVGAAVYSRAQRGIIPPGRILFTANQVTLDLRSKDMGMTLTSVAIGSLDDISFMSNQVEAVAFQHGGDIVMIDTFLASKTTVRVGDNLFMEGEDMSLYSLFSNGFINTTTCNQAAHCILVVGTQLEVDRDNLVILPVRCRDSAKYVVNHYHKKN